MLVHWHGLLAHLNTAMIHYISVFLAIQSVNVRQEPITVSQLGLIYNAQGHLKVDDNFLLARGRCDPGLCFFYSFSLTKQMTKKAKWSHWGVSAYKGDVLT